MRVLFAMILAGAILPQPATAVEIKNCDDIAQPPRRMACLQENIAMLNAALNNAMNTPVKDKDVVEMRPMDNPENACLDNRGHGNGISGNRISGLCGQGDIQRWRIQRAQ